MNANVWFSAHYNFLENLPFVVPSLLISGLRYPLTAAGMGVGWMVCRLIYAIGYTRSDKSDGKGRLVGSGFWLFQLGLMGMMGWTGIKMVL